MRTNIQLGKNNNTKKIFIFILFFITVFSLGITFGYMLFRQSLHDECIKYLNEYPTVKESIIEEAYNDLFKHAKNKGDVFWWYTEDQRAFKIRRMK